MKIAWFARLQSNRAQNTNCKLFPKDGSAIDGIRSSQDNMKSIGKIRDIGMLYLLFKLLLYRARPITNRRIPVTVNKKELTPR